MEIYLVRHGETEWNKEGRYYGFSDVGLSEKGQKQAKDLGKFFRKMEFDQVIVSPLLRAKQTGKELTNQHVLTDNRLREQNFGIFEGATYKELMEKYPEELQAWNENYESYSIPQGESFLMVRKRVDEFVEELWKMKDAGKKILIVAHKGTFGHMLASMLHLPASGYWNFVFDQGTYSRIDLEDGYPILRTINHVPAECNRLEN